MTVFSEAIPRLMALIATADRAELLKSRSLPSVLEQTRAADRIVLVDDSRDAGQSQRLQSLAEHHAPHMELLRNRRTRGASGAWNTGLEQLARAYATPDQVYVAILDDDDAWEPHHLEQAWRCIKTGAHIIAAPFLRIVSDGARCVMPPDELDANDFLIGNPGIQSSNLIVRLDLLLQAGAYDEALTSCTDRDALIRLARLHRGRYHRASEPSVRHFACADRPRLCTPETPARIQGLNAFFAKWEPQMSREQRAAAEDRARRYFAWRPTKAATPMSRVAAKHKPPDVTPEGIHLVVGLIADDRRIDGLSALFDDLAALRAEPGLLNLDCVLLENGDAPEARTALTTRIEVARRNGLRIHRIHHRDRIEAGILDTLTASPRLSIAHARTTLQTYLYHFATSRQGAVIWIIDDDMRLNPLVEHEGRMTRRRVPLLPQIQAMRARSVDIAIGRCTGAAPLPAAATVRVQLVDLLFNLRRLAQMPPDARLPSDRERNERLRRGCDYYYDLSHMRTDHLETPFGLDSVHANETAGEALERLTRLAPRILAGEPVFRYLTVPVAETEHLVWSDALYRGGNCFIFDPQVLRDAPNLAPSIGGRATRRSDMLWALIQKTMLGRRVESVSTAVYHDRAMLPLPNRLDVDGIADDLRGYAVFTALRDRMTSGREAIERQSVQYLEERLAELRLSFHRIRGLGYELNTLAGTEPGLSEQAQALRSLAQRVLDLYQPEALARIERAARALRGGDVAAFAARIPDQLREHQARVEDRATCIRAQLDRERIANARAAVLTLIPDVTALNTLGQGSEGVSLTDGQRVYKVFDYWKAKDAARAQALLARCVGRWPNGEALYPLSSWERNVLAYTYEASEPYRGGLGPGMVNLMVECHRAGLICRNIHPKNLRRVGAAVKLIDYGGDLRMPTDTETFAREFTLMCRRAFLSWRCWDRTDLAALLRRSRSDVEMPELAGHEYFVQAVQQVLGLWPPPPILFGNAPSQRRRKGCWTTAAAKANWPGISLGAARRWSPSTRIAIWRPDLRPSQGQICRRYSRRLRRSTKDLSTSWSVAESPVSSTMPH